MNDGKTFVLDTKWKVPEKSTPSDGDLHQMYVYLKEFEAERVALLYPQIDQEPDVNGNFIKGQKSCDMLFLPNYDSSQDWEAAICEKISEWITQQSQRTNVSPEFVQTILH